MAVQRAHFHSSAEPQCACEARSSCRRIRQERLRGEEVEGIVAHLVARGEAELQAGVVVTVRDGRIPWRSC
jgi:hypothetical protein